MFLKALTLVALVHGTAAEVDCRLACRRCRSRQDPDEMVEVYCAMCNECKERRLERMNSMKRADDCYTTQPECVEYPICSEPPPDCEPEQDYDIVRLKLTKKPTTTTPQPETTTTTTTTESTTTTTSRPCRPSRGRGVVEGRNSCDKSKTMPPCYCMPFQPMSWCPCPVQNQVPPVNQAQPTYQGQSTIEITTPDVREKLSLQKHNDYSYVYVGVPKTILNEQ